MADPVGGTSRPAPIQPSANGHELLPAEWPSQIADTIVDTVGTVRDKTAGPAVRASRAIVYGLAAGILGVVAIVILLILLIRLADNYLPGPLWIVYLLLGGIFTIGGVVLWIQAFRAPAEA
jgi:hypothetical protein